MVSIITTDTFSMKPDTIISPFDALAGTAAEVACDNAHDRCLPGSQFNTTNIKLEDNLIAGSENAHSINLETILNRYGEIYDLPKRDESTKSITTPLAIKYNTDVCNILDVFEGKYFPLGFNNSADSTGMSYSNFADELGVQQPVLLSGVWSKLLYQQKPEVFFFTAIHNYDILLYF